MNLKQLEAFIKVSDSKSFSKAAQELYLTQPTVSAHIQTLEKELKENSYPGRGIVIGRSADGKHAVTAYLCVIPRLSNYLRTERHFISMHVR